MNRENWKTVKLGDICLVSAGQGAPQGDSNYCDDGTPFVKAGNLIELIEGKSEFDIQKVSESVAKSHKLKKYSAGSILFAKSGMSCMKGHVYSLKNDSYVVSHLAILTPNSDSSKYIEYCLKYIKPNSLVKDEAYPSISLQDISNLEIPLPPLDVQKQIALNLDQVTKVIAEHKELLAKYDLLIKSRFIEMFGDPVTNPMGWGVEKGCELFSFSSGKFLEASKRLNSGVPVYGGNGIAWYTEQSLINFNTIIIGRVGAYCGNVKKVLEPVWVTDNAIYIKQFKKNSYNIHFLYELMLFLNFYQYADFSGQPKITQKPLENVLYILPPFELQQQFADFVQQIDKSKLVVQQSLEKAETLYKSLMQEYFG